MRSCSVRMRHEISSVNTHSGCSGLFCRDAKQQGLDTGEVVSSTDWLQ